MSFTGSPSKYGDPVWPKSPPQIEATNNNNGRGQGVDGVLHVGSGELSRTAIQDAMLGKPQNSSPRYIEFPPTPAPNTTH